ncbi:hypothetical protein JCM10213_004250 [Rhodosporidiobolus nylandii]
MFTSACHLPYDVLVEIFSWVAHTTSARMCEEELVVWPITSTCPSLPAFALVCTAWTTPAQALLFRAVELDTMERCEQFLALAAARPDLVKEVRAVSIGRLEPQDTGGDVEEEKRRAALTTQMLRAASLCRNTKNLQVKPMYFPLALQTFDLVKSLPQLNTIILKIFDVHVDISPPLCVEFYHALWDMLSKPTLRHFEHNFKPPYPPQAREIAPRIRFVASITAVHITVNVPPALFETLRAVKDSLTSLSIYTEEAFDPMPAASAFGTLQQLEQFRFESNVLPSNPAYEMGNFWLGDEVIPTYSKLERLSLTEQVLLPQNFTRLPPRLAALEYVVFSATPGDSLRQLKNLARASQAPCVGRKLIFVADEAAFADTVDPHDVEETKEAFRAKGGSFVVAHEMNGVLTRRMVEF